MSTANPPQPPFDYDAPLPIFPDYRRRSWEPAARHYRDLTPEEKAEQGL